MSRWRQVLVVVAFAAIVWAVWPLPWWRFLTVMVALGIEGLLTLYAIDRMTEECGEWHRRW